MYVLKVPSAVFCGNQIKHKRKAMTRKMSKADEFCFKRLQLKSISIRFFIILTQHSAQKLVSTTQKIPSPLAPKKCYFFRELYPIS